MNKSSVICCDSGSGACTYKAQRTHREGILKCFLRRNQGKFPEGGTQKAEEKPRQSCAEEPQVVWQLLEKSVFGGRWGGEWKEGHGAGELLPRQTPT